MERQNELDTRSRVLQDEAFNEAVVALVSEQADVEELAEVFACIAEKYSMIPDELNAAIKVAKASAESAES